MDAIATTRARADDLQVFFRHRTTRCRRTCNQQNWAAARVFLNLVFSGLTLTFGLLAQQSKADEAKKKAEVAFDVYMQEHRNEIRDRKSFLLDESPSMSKVDGKIQSGEPYLQVPTNARSPQNVPGGQIHHWIGAVFLHGVAIDRAVMMLKDYDHRSDFFKPYVLISRLSCRTGENRFGFYIQLHEHATLNTDHEVVWERVDDHHWRSRSFSTSIKEVGAQDHGYLWRLNSYWRFADTPNGAYVEGETISLSGVIAPSKRWLGEKLLGVSPKESLEHVLNGISKTLVDHPDRKFAEPPVEIGRCAIRP